MEAYDKLRKLRDAKDWHKDALALYDLWEQQLKESELDSSFYQLPQVKKMMEDLTGRVNKINEQLQTDRSLDSETRMTLFSMRDVFEIELSHLSGEYSRVGQIEKDIDAELEEIGEKTN